jgi:hypothetical protein
MSRRRLAVALLAAVVGFAVAGPVWAAVAPVRPAAQETDVAGYGLRALAAGVRYQLNSPGLLPVGDAAEGTIFEVDMPFARSIVTQGPVTGVVSSPLYPGDTAAHLGTAFATFGAPGIPNYPVVAEANYPPAPGFGQDASLSQTSAPGFGVGTATSHAGPEGATADARISSVSIPPTPPAMIEVGSSSAANTVQLQERLVSAQAVSHTGAITIAGLITIEGVTARATATSDGATGKPAAELEIGRVSVAGQPAYIDADGIHLVGQQPIGTGVVPGVESLLQKTLETDGITIRAVSPKITSLDGQATADAGGVVVGITRTVPALGVPGFPSLPGVPIPLGTPDLPLHVEVTFGMARATADATGVPGDDVAPGEDLPGADVSGASEVALDATGSGASASGALGLPQATRPATELTPAVATEEPGPFGSPIPVPWILAGVFASIVLCSPLLGYARWQLLEGRTR